MTDKTQDILKERGDRYGNYFDECEIIANLRNALNDAGCTTLTSAQENSLRMICMKLARIVNGNPSHEDNWRDIAGYATLIADRLESDPAGDTKKIKEYWSSDDKDPVNGRHEASGYIRDDLGRVHWMENDDREIRMIVPTNNEESPTVIISLTDDRVEVWTGPTRLFEAPLTNANLDRAMEITRSKLVEVDLSAGPELSYEEAKAYIEDKLDHIRDANPSAPWTYNVLDANNNDSDRISIGADLVYLKTREFDVVGKWPITRSGLDSLICEAEKRRF